jgi:hypothetical protein
MDGQNLCMQQSSVSNKVLVQQSYQKLVISFVNLLFIMRGMFLYSAHSYYYFVIPLLNVHYVIFNREYLQNNPKYLPAALVTYHYLLHIATSIYNTGPAWATWQYPMERLCGMLLPLVRSKQYPYINLQNQITMWIRFSHLQYKTEINQKLFGKSLEEMSDYSESRIFVIDGVKEKLYPPSHKYCMNRTEMQRLKAYYITALNKHANQLVVSRFLFSIYLCFSIF